MALALASIVPAAPSDPYAFFRRFHPKETFAEGVGQPLSSYDKAGRRILVRPRQWVRTFAFGRKDPSLLRASRAHVARRGGKAFDAPGRSLTVHFADSTEGIFDYGTYTLSVVEAPPVHLGRKRTPSG